ncbi:MAG: hypothetical protein UV79_C0006G0010 [candidate division TM6 bacterium GW2011_GWF2_43_17]|nr:MAG: hypothetical protein UV79_C0006G0010 [candidate division TM6 bacterium GW2011_GWF2_43_17]
MKSIVQEASSIEKAINKAWEEAGRPSEFSVRILEHPARNFFGFLKRSAKVALVFPSQGGTQEQGRERRPAREDRANRDKKHETLKRSDVQERNKKPVRQERSTSKPTESKNTNRTERVHANQTATSELSKALATETPKTEKLARGNNKVEETATVAQKMPKPVNTQTQEPIQSVWEPELVEKIKEQLNTLLELMDKTNATYTATVQGRELAITFSGYLLENEDQDRRLFSGLSPLLMTIIKREFKKALRGYRIVLGHAK